MARLQSGRPAMGGRPPEAHAEFGLSSRTIRDRLYAAITKYPAVQVFWRPFTRVFLKPPTVLDHPMISSTRFRITWLILYAALRQNRRAGERAGALSGIAKCGRMPRSTTLCGNSPRQYPLSPATVRGL